jgi:hypothetical protein
MYTTVTTALTTAGAAAGSGIATDPRQADAASQLYSEQTNGGGIVYTAMDFDIAEQSNNVGSVPGGVGGEKRDPTFGIYEAGSGATAWAQSQAEIAVYGDSSTDELAAYGNIGTTVGGGADVYGDPGPGDGAGDRSSYYGWDDL